MDLSRTSVSELATACRRETDRFRRGEPSTDVYCFELFRRAICDRDESSWEAVVVQYRGMVLAWVLRQGAGVAEDGDYWINRTFDRFWTAVRPERFAMFDGLPRVLKYLQMCATTAVLDERRSRRAAVHESLDGPDGARPETTRAAAGEETDVEGSAVDRLTAQELWDTVTRELPDEAERVVLHASFALGMKPAEIYERHPDLFPAVADVYRIKRNVLERLRRSVAVRRFVEPVPEKDASGRLLG
jgi:hypothetical protein